MEVTRVNGAAAVFEALGSSMLADEARHNLPLGILATARASPAVYPELVAWVVRAGGTTVGGALRTPPHNLILVRPSHDRVADTLAAAIDETLPGVVGALPEVEDFARAWGSRNPVTPVATFDQRIYRLEEVRPPTMPPGRMRLATPDDEDLVLERFQAFGEEVRHGPRDVVDEDLLARAVANRLRSADAGVALWEDEGEVVSLAGFGGPTGNGIRIGPVHTPRQSRGRGYGTAVTAELSRLMLDRGHRFCFLYTDLANPTSNSIYSRIGYEPVCDSREIAFVPHAN